MGIEMKRKLSRDEHANAIQAIAKLVPQKEGRRKLAAMFTKMLNANPDVKSVGREALNFAPVENSSQAVLTQDVNMEAYVVVDAAQYQVDIFKSRKVLIPQIHLSANLDMTQIDIKDCTYDLASRVRDMVKQRIVAKEDELIFAMFAKVCASNPYNPTITVAKADFNMETVIDASANIEGQDLEPRSMFINSANLAVFKKAGFNYLDDATKREFIQTGAVTVVNGLTLYKSRFVPKDTVFITATREMTGVCAEVLPLNIMPADDVRKQTIGFCASQHAGYACSNARAIQEIKLT